MSGNVVSGETGLAGGYPRHDPRVDTPARQTRGRRSVRGGGRAALGLLSALTSPRATPGEDGAARCHPACIPGGPQARLSAGHRAAEARGGDGQSQTRGAAAQDRQFALFARAEFPSGDDGQPAQPCDPPEPGASAGSERGELALVADLTYVRLSEAFVYLAVILDAFSRRWWVGRWQIICAPNWRWRRWRWRWRGGLWRVEGLIHHSDRGVQYACGDYVKRLTDAGVQPSMSRAGCPWDNAMVESFMATLKREEVDGRTYRDLDDAKTSIGRFLEEVYNRQRLHSALAYQAPEVFERAQRSEPPHAEAQIAQDNDPVVCV